MECSASNSFKEKLFNLLVIIVWSWKRKLLHIFLDFFCQSVAILLKTCCNLFSLSSHFWTTMMCAIIVTNKVCCRNSPSPMEIYYRNRLSLSLSPFLCSFPSFRFLSIFADFRSKFGESEREWESSHLTMIYAIFNIVLTQPHFPIRK